MHSQSKYNVIVGACLAVMLVPLASAQLMLSGNITGRFTGSQPGPGGPNETIVNAADGSSASFWSGIPETAGDLQTSIEFAQQDFTDIGPGLVADNIFNVTNGRTLLESTALGADFELNLALTSPEMHDIMPLTAIPFTIENTPNGEGAVDDMYSISWSAIAPFQVGNYMVQFEFMAPPMFSIEENTSLRVGQLWVNFTPVPEPSTYAAFGAALLVGVIGFRRLRQRRLGSTA